MEVEIRRLEEEYLRQPCDDLLVRIMDQLQRLGGPFIDVAQRLQELFNKALERHKSLPPRSEYLHGLYENLQKKVLQTRRDRYQQMYQMVMMGAMTPQQFQEQMKEWLEE
jgi:hypothetical protein